ncbi:carbon-nitrogen family hydrolase [Halalkalibacter nanhaiisediminis]|uniref:Putative amidohydrolase n=1 Tax=Halalkalibacter nanhaiisediminis TaxID=688079 RepID=A0A562QCQ4_9BACI|nr:carbon-nitrogen family hydrolase [Halalkalibacter nanhaiisediminis]TWI54489.1 putative amidohydrolase [Halalkalibacter nanhaiisediminis]
MKIAVYQMDLVAGQPNENRKRVKNWVEQVTKQEQLDLLVLPEMWTTAYTLEDLPTILEADQENTEQFLQQLAKEHHIHIVAGSMAVKEGDEIYNRAFVMNKNGQTEYTYDKVHLVPMLDEPLYLTGGKNSAQVFELDGRKMGVIICYDLRFPELIRSLALQGAEVVFVVAEWPLSRKGHWEVLQQARAIENQVFIVSCNRVGTHDGVEFAGSSMVIDPWGEVLEKGSVEQEETLVTTLNLSEVERIRKEVPVFSSRRPNLYK